jgi:hypothetical protein
MKEADVLKKNTKGMACKDISLPLRDRQWHNACAYVQLPLRYSEIRVQPLLITGVGWGYDETDLKLESQDLGKRE